MSLADATTIDLSPWRSRLQQRPAVHRAAPHPLLRLLVAVLAGVARFVAETARIVLIAVVVFTAVLLAGTALTELWR